MAVHTGGGKDPVMKNILTTEQSIALIPKLYKMADSQGKWMMTLGACLFLNTTAILALCIVLALR